MQRRMGATIQDLVCSVDLQLEIARKLSFEVQKLFADLERRTAVAQERQQIQTYVRRRPGDPSGTKISSSTLKIGAPISMSACENAATLLKDAV